MLNIIVIVVFLAFTIWSFRRLPMIYSLYTLVMVLMPLATGSSNSISRYYLIIFSGNDTPGTMEQFWQAGIKASLFDYGPFRLIAGRFHDLLCTGPAHNCLNRA